MNLPEHIQKVQASADCLYNKAQVEAALDKLAAELTQAVGKLNPMFICVVIGGIIPLGHLLTRLNFPLTVDYIHATRYRSGTSGHDISWKSLPHHELSDRVVVVVDDILDDGITLKAVLNYCQKAGAKKTFTAVLVDKQKKRLPEGLAKADFTGLKAENRYLFGYGMDYKEYLRNAPGIYAVAEAYE